MSTKRFLSTFFLLLVFLFSGMTMVYAQDRVTPEPPVDIPQIWRMGGLEIEYQRVNVTIKDQVATTHIEQLFVNDSDQMLEGTYLFPLPQGDHGMVYWKHLNMAQSAPRLVVFKSVSRTRVRIAST